MRGKRIISESLSIICLVNQGNQGVNQEKAWKLITLSHPWHDTSGLDFNFSPWGKLSHLMDGAWFGYNNNEQTFQGLDALLQNIYKFHKKNVL